jgi:hypothetical protein
VKRFHYETAISCERTHRFRFDAPARVTCCCEAICNWLPSAVLTRRKPDEEIADADDLRRVTTVSRGSFDPSNCGEPCDWARHP